MEKSPAKESRLNYIEAIRCFAILSLVVWHCICVYTGWMSYLPDITAAVENNILTKIYMGAAILIMPDANMPLFVMVAAYVYVYLWNKGAYRDIKVFFKKKAKRLVIPYFVIGTLVVFTIFDWEPLSLIYGEAHHLWFCAMLFWCFILIRIYEKLPPAYRILLIICGIAIQIKPFTYDLLGIVKGLRYFPYFLFGYYLYSYLPKFRCLKYSEIIAISIWLLTLFSYFVLKRVEPICYTYCFMIFVLVPEDIKVPSWVTKISMYSFGIYVFHEWFLWNAAHLQILHPFIIRYQILYPTIAFVSVFSVSYLLTHFSLKTKIGRFLLA